MTARLRLRLFSTHLIVSSRLSHNAATALAYSTPPAYSRSLKSAPQTPNHTTGELHPRNRHRAPYDFPRLIRSSPELARFRVPHPLGGDTIDFADPSAVIALNRALLKHHYGLAHWDIPRGYLCPPVPSRVDYLHHVADLLAADHSGNTLPRGPAVAVLDIGTGANCVYPLLGAREYGWRFIGTDIDRAAVDWANQLVAANPDVAGNIECRLQPSPAAIFENVVRPGERFALSICNPPFHASPAEAAAGTLRKLKNLRTPAAPKPLVPTLNFGGQSTELWCDGGESAFVRRMIAQSARQPELCGWFTTLVSKRGNLPAIYRELKNARALDVHTVPMFAGQKQSRIVAWTFLDAARRRSRLL